MHKYRGYNSHFIDVTLYSIVKSLWRVENSMYLCVRQNGI